MIRISWAWTPVIVIGLAAVANAGIIIAGLRVRPEAVEDRPWLASVGFDARKAAEARFAAGGMRLTAEAEAGGIRVRLEAPALVNARLALYRPDERGLDHVVAWPDPTQPLRLALPRAGVWHVRLTATAADGQVETELHVGKQLSFF